MKLNKLFKKQKFFVTLSLFFVLFFGFAYKSEAASIITGRVGLSPCGVYIYGIMLEKSSYGVNEDIKAKIVYSDEFSGVCIVDIGWMLNNSFISGDTPDHSLKFDSAPWISLGKTQAVVGTQALYLSLDVSISTENYFDGGWDTTTFGIPIKDITIDVGSVSVLAPRVFLSGNPTSVVSGGKTTLTWESLNNYPATECIASSEPSNSQWTGSKPIPINNGDKKTQDITNLTQTTTFRLACKNSGGSDSLREVTINIKPILPPRVFLSGNPTSVVSGGKTTLTWESLNNYPATECIASSEPSNSQWTGSKPIPMNNGDKKTQDITNLTQTTTFKLACKNSGGSDSLREVTVSVSKPLPPTVTLTTDPLVFSVKKGDSVNLKWTQFGRAPDSCIASSVPANSQWSGNVAIEGTKTISNIQTETTFSIICSNAGGSDESSKLIKITTTIPKPPYVSLVLNPSSIKVGESTEVSWFVRRADKCTASGYPGIWEGVKTFIDSDYTKITINNFKESKTLTLTCENIDGVVSDSVDLTVTSAPPPVAPGTLTLKCPSLPIVNGYPTAKIDEYHRFDFEGVTFGSFLMEGMSGNCVASDSVPEQGLCGVPKYYGINFKMWNTSWGAVDFSWRIPGRHHVKVYAIGPPPYFKSYESNSCVIMVQGDKCPNVPGEQASEEECFLDIGLRIKAVKNELICDYSNSRSRFSSLFDSPCSYEPVLTPIKIAAEAGTPTSPLRIKRNTNSGVKTFGIALVPPGDPNATGWIIKVKDKNGVLKPMALRKL